MYTLIKFYNNDYYVCKSDLITINDGVIEATYSDQRKYAAEIIAKNGKFEHLLICFTLIVTFITCELVSN
jgi:hypothetical protein